MVIDYNHFAYVITFGTTYTNWDARPHGVFLGLNRHKEIIIFGVTLLYDEIIEFFVWSFKTILEAISEKKPITIYIFFLIKIAMSFAIQVVMLETYHALHSLHMWHNSNKHLGHLFKSEAQFNQDS